MLMAATVAWEDPNSHRMRPTGKSGPGEGGAGAPRPPHLPLPGYSEGMLAPAPGS